MPANLTPRYLEAERRFKEARSTEEKIEALTEMLAVIPKHKGTDKLRGMLRRRMARLHDDAQKKGAGKKAYDPYLIRKEGAGQIALFGLPNSGKSSLMCGLTRASSPIEDYPFSTRKPIPGMMTYEDISIQLVDMPPLMDEASESWRPRVLRRADSIAFILDAAEDAATQMEILAEGLWEIGLSWKSREDAAEGARPVLGFICLNKSDLLDNADNALECLSGWQVPLVATSSVTGDGLDAFRKAAFLSLGIIRIYTKAPHKKVRFTDPLILPAGATLEEAARALHKDFASGLRYARIWGDDFFDGQMAGKDQLLHDKNVLELHIR